MALGHFVRGKESLIRLPEDFLKAALVSVDYGVSPSLLTRLSNYESPLV